MRTETQGLEARGFYQRPSTTYQPVRRSSTLLTRHCYIRRVPTARILPCGRTDALALVLALPPPRSGVRHYGGSRYFRLHAAQRRFGVRPIFHRTDAHSVQCRGAGLDWHHERFMPLRAQFPHEPLGSGLLGEAAQLYCPGTRCWGRRSGSKWPRRRVRDCRRGTRRRFHDGSGSTACGRRSFARPLLNDRRRSVGRPIGRFRLCLSIDRRGLPRLRRERWYFIRRRRTRLVTDHGGRSR